MNGMTSINNQNMQSYRELLDIKQTQENGKQKKKETEPCQVKSSVGG